MQDTLTCPYCNAILTDTTTDTAGRRVCSTCGESFEVSPGLGTNEAVRAQETGIREPSANLAPQVERALQPDLTKPRRSNRATAIGILVVMLVMAGAGLGLALKTQDVRRANDRGIRKNNPRRSLFMEVPSASTGSSRTRTVRPQPPARLVALRYLPRKTNLLVGLHVAELRQDPLGRDLLSQSIEIGPVKFELSSLSKWTGLPMEELDHCVFGVSTDTGPIPRINVVVRSRRAFDPASVRSRLNATRVFDAAPEETKELYRVKLEPPGLDVVLWCADERTLVYGFLAPDLYGVPNTPHSDLSHLPHMMTELLRQRTKAETPVWAAADIADWEGLEKAAWFRVVGSKLNPDTSKRLHGLRACVASLRFDDKPSASVVFRCGDEAEATALAELVGGPMWKEMTRLGLVVRDAYLTLQFETSVERVRKALGR